VAAGERKGNEEEGGGREKVNLPVSVRLPAGLGAGAKMDKVTKVTGGGVLVESVRPSGSAGAAMRKSVSFEAPRLMEQAKSYFARVRADVCFGWKRTYSSPRA
jgi:hypothetical protein